MNGIFRFARTALGAAIVVSLGACGGSNSSGSSGEGEDSVLIQKGTYVYNPNRRHAPVSLSRADLQGIEIR